MSRLRALLAGPVLEVAPALLGMRLRSSIGGIVTEVVLTEVEAYEGANDPASHAYNGQTPRTRSMFDGAGTLYVYRSYGIHWCMNIVTGKPGVAAAVLLRGGLPTRGLQAMIERRGRADHTSDGPGKLCQALGVTGDDDGIDVLGRGAVQLLSGRAPARVERSTRVGISKATDRPWRFSAVLDL